MVDPFNLARLAAEYIVEKTKISTYDIAIVVGSGWGDVAKNLGDNTHNLESYLIPGFNKPKVAGHKGNISCVISANNKRVLVISARSHFYEHRDIQKVAHSVRTAAALGVKTVILTNGCGSINPNFQPGTPVLISDHINLTGISPILGANFVDLTNLYSPRIRNIAKQLIPNIGEGVYVQFAGPNYETPAEIRMAKTIGGDLVGMSTALEAIAAREANLEIFGISLVTNLAAGITAANLSHSEVLQVGAKAQAKTSAMLAKIVTNI